MIPWLLLTGLAAPLAATDLASSIRGALATPAARGAHWGIQITEVNSGRVIYQLNANRFFVPASNTNLFSTALALARLGPDHRFHTRVLAEQPPTEAGIIEGPLILAGGGDPNLSGRVVPYNQDAEPGDPLGALEDLAAQVAEAGVRRVRGGIIGDDTAYVWAPFPEGWASSDPVWEYGAPVSALTFNDNTVSLTVAPGERADDLARLTLTPAVEFYQIDNRVRTIEAGEREITVDRDPGGLQLRLWGVIPRRGVPRSYLLGIQDPALFAAMAFRDALSRRGITVEGITRARHRYPGEITPLEGPVPVGPPPTGVELASRSSHSLIEDLRIIDKVSQNLHAELALRAVAKSRRGVGSREAGLAELTLFLAEAGIKETEYELFDGSGLSRLNLVTPAAISKLLLFMYRSPHRKAWMDLLPVGAADGTLRDRFSNLPSARGVQAKTGTLSHVSALSGYASGRGGVRAFSILVNNYRSRSSEVRAVIDRIVGLLVE